MNSKWLCNDGHKKHKNDLYAFISFSLHNFPNSFPQRMEKSLNRNIDGLEDFKMPIQIISTIQSTNIAIELQLHEIQDTFAVLKDHKIAVSRNRLQHENNHFAFLHIRSIHFYVCKYLLAYFFVFCVSS